MLNLVKIILEQDRLLQEKLLKITKKLQFKTSESKTTKEKQEKHKMTYNIKHFFLSFLGGSNAAIIASSNTFFSPF